MSLSFPPEKAWHPLPAAEWNIEMARHLLRRTGWSATPGEVGRALADGLDATLERLFPSTPVVLAKPRTVEKAEASVPDLIREARQKSGNDRLEIRRELRRREMLALNELQLSWLEYAAQPRTAAFAKWTLFLSDVYVVSAQKVQSASAIFQHFDILARHALGSAPALTKAVSRSPAMVIYLDLNQSRRHAPNENFARELFELFILGEGNYTEHDIKESARAFTGYRAQPLLGRFRYVPNQHDPTEKTIFGQTGRFTGDDVIDLAYRQKAVASFLPHEMVKFYLSDTPLPPEFLATLGDQWRETGFDLRTLARTFFGSRIFFAPEFRGNFIKSPIQFYLGLLQDLGLSVSPIPRMNVYPMRQMGQWLFYPPNVRGWVGGRRWINSATITARRQLVEMLFAPIHERGLNADELIDLAAAESNGITNFTVSDAQLAMLAESTPESAAETLVRSYLATGTTPSFREDFAQFIGFEFHNPHQRLSRVRRAAATLLQSPEYQLC